MTEDFVSTYKLRVASSVSAALKKLPENELVCQTYGGYMVYDRFMAEWRQTLLMQRYYKWKQTESIIKLQLESYFPC